MMQLSGESLQLLKAKYFLKSPWIVFAGKVPLYVCSGALGMSLTTHRNCKHKLEVIIKFDKLFNSADKHLFKKIADQ